MTGWSAGFTFWYTGGVGIWGGSSGAALAMAACTSWAAPSMERSSENWMVMAVRPCALDDVIESMPAIVVNCFSSGVAMAEAIVSGLARQRCLNLDRREVDVGQVAHRQQAIRHD